MRNSISNVKLPYSSALHTTWHRLKQRQVCNRSLRSCLPNRNLCEFCRNWNDSEHAFNFYCIPPVDGEWNAAAPKTLASLLDRHGCMVCHAIGLAILEKLGITCSDDVTGANEITIEHFGPFCFQDMWSPPGFSTVRCIFSVGLRKGAANETANEPIDRSDNIGIQLELRYDKDGSILRGVDRWEPRYLDLSTLQSRIKDCETLHGTECFIPTVAPIEGFKLIDTFNKCVVEPSSGCRYVALSYVWQSAQSRLDGQSTEVDTAKLYDPGALDKLGLPDIVQDAIVLCFSLGERFLWVDRVCILQNDSAARHKQIRAMDRIYGQAAFTIVAAVDSKLASGLPGARGRPRLSSVWNQTRQFSNEVWRSASTNILRDYDESIWNTRGWTFQERLLSRKCLIITNYDAYYMCSNECFQLGRGVIQYPGSDGSWFHGNLTPLRKMTSLESYLNCVASYTSRTLSFPEDILNAFAGVTNAWESILETEFLYGLAVRYLTQSLLWTPNTVRRSNVPDIPSWSWAAARDAVTYKAYWNNYVVNAKVIGTLVRFHAFDGRSSLRKLDAEETWFGEAVQFSQLPWDAKLPCRHNGNFGGGIPYWPFDDMTEHMWRWCPQNPWTVAAFAGVNVDLTAIAVAFPNALVFNTTVASLYVISTPNDDGFCDIQDYARITVGVMAQTDPDLVKSSIETREWHEFIVLCAGIAPKRRRSKLGWDAPDPQPGLAKRRRAYLLHGVLIERDEESPSVCRRIALGSVCAHFWRQCCPRWETIVLV